MDESHELAEIFTKISIAESLVGKNAVTLDLAPGDLGRAQDLAAKRGLPCEEFLRDLVHEALNAELQRDEQLEASHSRFIEENDPVQKSEAGSDLIRTIFGYDALAKHRGS